MAGFNGFAFRDFDNLVCGDAKSRRVIRHKLALLVDDVYASFSPELKERFQHRGLYPITSGIYCGFFYRFKQRQLSPFYIILVTADDVTLELRLEGKKAVMQCLCKAKAQMRHFLELIEGFKALKDVELAVWDYSPKGHSKVCKLYPDYIDADVVEFLSLKIKKTTRPVIKFRRIFSRDESVLYSKALAEQIAAMVEQLDELYEFIG